MSRPVHFEILADDPAGVAEFYRKALGWDSARWEGQTYWLVTTGPAGTPGINGGIMGHHFAQRVINTIEVESLQDALAKVESAGGTRVHGPSQLPGVGLHAYCTDPEGTMFGLLQPSRTA